jgi:hypothetical protein
MTRYKPGDTYTHQMLEFVAHHDRETMCAKCIGDLHTSVCAMLPLGCGSDQIYWRPSNESAMVLHAILKLEGTI